MIISTLHNKISACHHENLDLSSYKSRPFIKKILTCYHENLKPKFKKQKKLLWKNFLYFANKNFFLYFEINADQA